jgi:methyl-accepting chemotaxis protein
MNPEKAYKRRIVFIKKEYQAKFIAKFCLILLAGGVISTLLVLLLSRGTLTTSFEHGRLIVKDTAAAILPTVLLTNAITLVIVIFIAVLTVLYVSHKIAGPMFRFEKDITSVKDGDLTRQINLRKEDQFSDLSKSMNEMISGLREKILAIESEIERVRNRCKKPEEIKKEEIASRLDRLVRFIKENFQL